MQKIFIDTDPGQDIDDLLAIWFALLRPELQVVGISTVTYPSDKRARLIKRLLRYLDRADVPVAAGQQFPLRPVSEDESRTLHDLSRAMNHYAFAEPEDTQDDPSDADGVDLIIRAVEQHPNEVVLCCIAPLTNIATALSRRPDIKGKIKRIALMGGETALNRREHNIAFDYVASRIVFESGIPISMGTWDVTRRFTLTMEECEQLGVRGSPLTKAMADAVRRWHPAQNWKPGPVMYDLFPIVWSFDQSLYKVVPMRVQVETAGEFTRGMTVATGGPPNADVTVDADAAALKAMYLETLRGT
ncbi:MAG TPA: nucleoside hydrolase [Tepidisphaeraceae bacterium]|jgi:purine nucleosidase/pyrimidine-specific ribonucleoside hydrolase|nr:nucleoside hydrolase [Tepidisphaeraceae bacterium]